MSDSSKLVADILLNCSRGDSRLFRVNSGMAWSGTIVKKTPSLLILSNYHAVRLAQEGFPDTAGFTSVIVTPEMIGSRLAIFSAIEAKTGTGRATASQNSFLDMTRAMGGRAGVARSVEDATKILLALK